jgi:hypothetical protein
VTIGGGRRPGGARFSTAAALPDVTRHEGSVSMPAAVVTGFEMLRRKLPRRGALLAVVFVLAACTAADDDGPEVAPIDDLGTEEAPTETEEQAVDVDDVEEERGEPTDDPDPGTEQADDATEAADADPYAIPEGGIDEAYVERVLNAIFEVNREALAITLESEPGGLAPFEAEERLRAIYAGDYGAATLVGYNEIASSLDQRALFLDQPGAVRVRVLDLVATDESCIVARQSLDFSSVLRDAPPIREEFVALASKPSGEEDENLNPTPWQVVAADSGAAAGVDCE